MPPIAYPRGGSRVMPQPVGPVGPVMPPRYNPAPVGPAMPFQGTFKKGGKVPKTGAYLLHKDEHVIPKGKRKMTNRKPEKLVSIAALKA